MTNKEEYTKERKEHWNKVVHSPKGFSGYYHSKLTSIYRFIIPADKRVLELGCSEGDLLASLAPSYGLGMDFSEEMINRAKNKYTNLNFIVSDAHSINLDD